MFQFRNQIPSETGRSVDIEQRDYIPQLHPNGDYVFRSRCFSLLNMKYSGVNRSYTTSLQDGLRVKRRRWLQTNYGFSRRHAETLLSRSPATLRRIEDCVHGIVDAFLLFDWRIFVKDSPYRKGLRRVVRKSLSVGAHSVGDLMQLWKEVTNFLYNRYAGFEPQIPAPTSENFLWRFLREHPDVQRMISGVRGDKFLAEKFAHLTSTRHFASGDRRAAEKSLEKFFRTIEEPYDVNPRWMRTIFTIAQRVGEKCKRLPGNRATLPHVSLSTAGSYFSTVKDGGRGKEVREALQEILTIRPLKDEVIETPFANLKCPAGKERWRYWCRAKPYDHYPNVAFGDVITEEYFGIINGEEQHLYYQGFDEAIGNQILVVAFLKKREWDRTGLGIPCRVLTVPEPGYKARIVTTGPFWLNNLQQSVAHSLKSFLSRHPSARSSLMKTDQAWQALYLLQNKRFPEGSAVLSSDLSEATDCIPKVVGYQLLMGFMLGVGFQSNFKHIAADLLLCNRSFTGPGYVSERQTRGIMMGEPLTKVVLTILNLVVEEYAIRRYMHISPERMYFESPPWRSYHIGGDDHLAIGPVRYLNEITDCHLKCGSKISLGKHGISTNIVKYCEKVLDVSKIENFSIWDINTLDGYEVTPFVDSIKVRLLSPLTKAYEVSSERNIAIGKGLSLGRTLKWMNTNHFPRKWVRMVRDRFFQRMGSLLPDRSSRVYWQLMLPIQWGGLDLYLPDEIPEMYSLVPELTKSIMEAVRNDEPKGHEDAKLLRKLLSNYSYRGYRLNETDVSLMNSHIEDVVVQHFPRSTWREIKKEFDPAGKESAKTIADLAWAEGWKGIEDIYDELMRPILFKEILLGREKAQVYNTEPLKRRYAKLWDMVYRGPSSLSEEEFKEMVGQRPPGFFYKVGYPEEIHFVSDRGYIYKSALDDALNGMPVLRISKPFI